MPGDPSPALVVDNTWRYGSTPPAQPCLFLTTGNVARLTVDMLRAGFVRGQASTVTTTTDGPVELRLTGLAPGTTVRIGTTAVRADGSGTAVVQLPSGAGSVRIG